MKEDIVQFLDRSVLVMIGLIFLSEMLSTTEVPSQIRISMPFDEFSGSTLSPNKGCSVIIDDLVEIAHPYDFLIGFTDTNVSLTECQSVTKD